MATKTYNVLSDKCPTQQVLTRIGGKWTMLVILALGEGTQRYSDLRKRLPKVTQKMLTETLRALERDGMVDRRVYDSVPIRTEYTLTPLGQSLADSVAVIRNWAYDNMDDITVARTQYDSQSEAPLDDH
jgi:DNA-binding HxlR family transcriptional regulator